MESIGWFAIVLPERDSECASAKSEKLDQSSNSEGSEHMMDVRRTQGASSKPAEGFGVVALMIARCFISFNLILRGPSGRTSPCAVDLLHETDRISPRPKDSSSVLIRIVRE
jgi:hypothetical protein